MKTHIASRSLGRLALLSISALVLAGCATLLHTAAFFPPPGLEPAVGQHPYSSTVTVIGPDHIARTTSLSYLLYLPEGFGKNPGQRWPLILFLHGRGERGSDFANLLKQPLPKLLAGQSDFPFVVLSPLLSTDKRWWNDLIDPIDSLVDRIVSSLPVDPQRLYLTGISMGGFGVWEYALRYPHRFAALVPIASGYLTGGRLVPPNICVLRDTPMWVFHGESDLRVPLFLSATLVDSLRACGGNVRFTRYSGLGHAASWNRAYAEPGLFEWLSAQHLH